MQPDSSVRPGMPQTPVSRLAIAVCAFMLVAGLTGVVISWGAYRVDSGLAANGTRATGIVLKKEFLRAADGDSDHLITYRFALPNGEQVVAQHGLSKDQWTGLKEGSELVIIYSPTNPKRSFPEGAGATSVAGPILITAIFGSVAALGGVVLFQLLRSAGNTRKA
jgi:hypothetical protein